MGGIPGGIPGAPIPGPAVIISGASAMEDESCNEREEGGELTHHHRSWLLILCFCLSLSIAFLQSVNLREPPLDSVL